MKPRILVFPLLALALLPLAGCANNPPRDADGNELKLHTIYRPDRPPVYQFRKAD